MFPTSVVVSFFLVGLSATTLAPASDNQNPDHPPPVQHVKRGLSLPNNISNITNSPSTPSSLTTANAFVPNCYPPDPQEPPIHPSDCYTALYILLASPSAMLLKHWDRNSNLPVEHLFGTCSIILARTTASSVDIFQEVLVAHAAAMLLQICVTARRGYQGGTMRIGVRGVFAVFLSNSASASGAGDGAMRASATA